MVLFKTHGANGSMVTGFEKIVEERIQQSIKKGEFDNLPGMGKPLNLDDFTNVPGELRMAYKILKNADCLPPEIELKKEILQAETLLHDMKDTKQKYHILKKLNYLIMKLNTLRGGSIAFEIPQKYEAKLVERMSSSSNKPNKP